MMDTFLLYQTVILQWFLRCFFWEVSVLDEEKKLFWWCEEFQQSVILFHESQKEKLTDMKKSWSTEYVGNSMKGEELKGSQWPGTNKTQDGETRFVSFYSRCRSVGEYRPSQTYVPMCTRTSSYWKYLVVVYLSSSTGVEVASVRDVISICACNL